jgi:hypothetical protein
MNDQSKKLLPLLQMDLSELWRESAKPLTREIIGERIEAFMQIPSYSSADKDWLLTQLEALFTIWAPPHGILVNDIGHIPWLHVCRSEIDWNFWNRYETYLIKDVGLSPAAIGNIDRVSDEVLSSIEEPKRSGAWDRRGLVMGNVQSGKTGTYTGLICKAADAGYKVIIVLAGMHNNLRSQTQVRLDEGFLGYTASEKSRGAREFVGVFNYGKNAIADSVTNKFERGDFNSTAAKQFQIHPGGNPLLFVVKKNTKVLENLLAWINGFASDSDSETGRKIHKDIPLLVIDDEADQASIDIKAIAENEAGDQDPEHDPSVINGHIRKILHAFDKSAYVGFTATPFANIFINDESISLEYGKDLFPESFIINLEAPSNYIGASEIFGIDANEELGIEEKLPLPIVESVFDYVDDIEDRRQKIGWMPPRSSGRTDHVPLHHGKEEIPPSLHKAILCFILSSLVRTYRESSPLFNSMLVHVTRITNVQNRVKNQVEMHLKSINHRLKFGDGAYQPTILDEFKEIWFQSYVPTSKICGETYILPDWEYVRNHLNKISSSIQVMEINGSASDSLNYDLHETTGLNVIAVGGDKLSRGLTLEGLVVSYFLRSSRMYDTLMQMGRWFGYKEKYLDLCRLFTTDELRGWFRHIAVASEELRQEFNYMNTIKATPIMYGLKVRSHPAMMITSQVKMRSGTKMKLSYAGDISETTIFYRDPTTISKNLDAVRSLIESIGIDKRKTKKSCFLWEDVKSNEIIEFLGRYQTHPDARRANTKFLSDYISLQVNQNELVNWTVVLASIQKNITQKSRDGTKTITNDVGEYFWGLDVGSIYRDDVEELDTKNRYTIKRLVDPSHEYLDLTEPQIAAALEITINLWQVSTRKNKSTEPPSAPGGKGTREVRDKRNGLLILYPLSDIEKSTSTSASKPIMGIAVSFPDSDTAKEITYVVNNVYTSIDN